MTSLIPDLANAAREFIDDRIDLIKTNHFGDYTAEDLASAEREAILIEQQIIEAEHSIRIARDYPEI